MRIYKMFAVVIGDIGKRIRQARMEMKPVPPTAAHLARELAVTPARLNNWEMGRSDPPYEIIRRVAEFFNKSIDEFYGDSGPKGVDKQTGVYYSKDREIDSELDERLLNAAIEATDPRTIRCATIVGEGANIWSAKGARREMLNLTPFFVTGRTLIKIQDESLGTRIKSNTVLAFTPDDYARIGIYLLCANKSNPDLQTIRYIDPDGDPTSLVAVPASGIKPERLTEWDVIGFATVEIRGARSGVPEIDYRPAGIGPKTR